MVITLFVLVPPGSIVGKIPPASSGAGKLVAGVRLIRPV